MSWRTTRPIIIAAALALVLLPVRSLIAGTWTVRLGGLRVDGSAHVHARSELQDPKPEFHSGRINFGQHTVPRIEASFQFSGRHRLAFNFFQYEPHRDYVLDQDIVVRDWTIPAGSQATLNSRFKLGSMVYDYSVVQQPVVSLGLQAGLAWGAIDNIVHVRVDEHQLSAGTGASGMAPVLGLRLSLHDARQRWLFRVQGQYLNADWGHLGELRGELMRINALLAYRLTRHFELHAGFDVFHVQVNNRFGPARGGIKLRFQGPTTGFGLRF